MTDRIRKEPKMRHRRTSRAASTVVFVVGTAVVAGCSSSEAPEDERSLDLDEPSATTSESAESPSADEDAEEPDAIPTSYPDVGLEFGQLPQAPSGPRRAALESYVEYERGVRQLGRTGEIGGLIRDSAAPEVVDGLQSTVDYLRENDARYRGTVLVDVTLGATTSRSVEVEACSDGTDLELVEGDRLVSTDETGGSLKRITVTDAGGGWFVTRSDPTEEAC